MKNEKYEAPLNIYISSSYNDAELAQKFLSDYVKGFGITVDKQRNGDELYVTIDGLDEDIEALVSVYTAQYDEFKKDCKAEPSGWVSPVNFEKSKEDESMKSESNIEDLRDQTISWGTMRSEDLIPKFLGVLKTYAKDKYDEYVNENPEVLDIDGLDDETLGWIVDELFDKLDEIAPEGTYFGAHPDDGADYGFWSVDESKQRESKKSEAYEDIWRGAKVMTHDEACEQLDYVKEIEDDIISEYGEDYYEDPDAVDEYNQRINNYIDSCFDQDFVSINGEEIPLGVSRDPKLLIVLTDDTEHGDEAVELVKKLANGELTGSSDDGDYVAIMDGVNGSPHFDIYSEEPKSEGKSDKDGKDDKDGKGKGCDGSDEKCGGNKNKENRGKPQEGSSASNNWVAYYFCKDPQGLEWAVLPHTVSMIGNVNCVNARGGMESIGKEYVLSKCTPVEDVESSEIWKAVCDGEDRKVVAIDRDDAERVLRAENGLEELKSVVAGKSESKKNEKGTTKIETYDGFEELLEYAGAEYVLEDVVDVLSKYYTYEGEGEDIFFGEDQAKGDPEFTIKIEGGDERADYYCENIFYVHLPSKDAAEELAKVLGGELNESKKNEADATFKVGDFVTYDAASDGKEDFINEYVSAEIAEINDDGSLVLWIYDLDDGGNDVNDADPQFCTKLDHYAGKVDADHYYMDGPYKAYKGGWEILITKKDLNPRVYEFIGTMDDLGEVLDVDAYYGGENFSYDIDLKDTLESSTPFDVNGFTFADMSGDTVQRVDSPEESKKSESLTLKQAELKKMAKYGEAEDITGLSDAEAKELKKSGVELVGISRGTYGMNGALMRGTADGKLYVITSRNSNLFYFV